MPIVVIFHQLPIDIVQNTARGGKSSILLYVQSFIWSSLMKYNKLNLMVFVTGFPISIRYSRNICHLFIEVLFLENIRTPSSLISLKIEAPLVPSG